MTEDKEIIEALLGMAYDKATEIYSVPLVEYGMNPKNYGILDHPEGYAKITGT